MEQIHNMEPLRLGPRLPITLPLAVLACRNPAGPGRHSMQDRSQHRLIGRRASICSVQHLQSPHFDDANLSRRPVEVIGKAKVVFP
jgi:hypothetical protein